MKHLVLFAFILLGYTTISAQNYINEIVIEHEMVEVSGYSYIGQAKQMKTDIRTLDSLNIRMIIAKRKYEGSEYVESMGIDTLYIKKGKIVEQIRFQNCYTAKYDAKGRVTEKRYTRTPNSAVETLLKLNYDAFGFPVYFFQDDDGMIWEHAMRPYYNTQGILDSIAYLGKNGGTTGYATFKQDVYKNGDSIVITRTSSDPSSDNPRYDYFVRTVFHDTVQVRFYQDNTIGFQEYTRSYLNGKEVESYFYNFGVYTDVSTYNRFGLPAKSFGYGVTNEGNGNRITDYEYYTVDPKKKHQFRLVNLE